MRLLWSQQTETPLRGLVLAGERNWVLAWDASSWLHLFNAHGERQAQVRSRGPLVAAACAEDGRSYATITSDNQVSLLAPDLMPRWEFTLGALPLALALAPLGEFLAVSDSGGGLHLFSPEGKLVWKTALPRPFRHLTFIPEQPLLAGCADYGLVACVNALGEVVWRDGLVAHAGAIACSALGRLLVVACSSDGLWCYDSDRKRRQLLGPAPCRLAALSYQGDVIATAGLERKLHLFDGVGGSWASHTIDGSPVGVALTPLGDTVLVGLAEGKIQAWQLQTPKV